MTNVNTNNTTGNVHVTASKQEEVKLENGVDKVNIVQIPFVPQVSIMNISSHDLTRSLNTTLRPIIDGYMSSRLYAKGNSIGFQICVNVSSRLIKTSVLSMLGATNSYSMSDELRAKLTPFLSEGDVTTSIVNLNKSRDKAMIIELNALKTLTQLIQTVPDGFVYNITLGEKMKNKEVELKITMMKKPEKIEERIKKDNHFNRRNNNNNNYNRNNNNNHNKSQRNGSYYNNNNR